MWLCHDAPFRMMGARVLLIGIVRIHGDFPCAIALLLPDDQVFAFVIGGFALLVGSDEIVRAGFVGQLAGARDLERTRLPTQAGAGQRDHGGPIFANIFAASHGGSFLRQYQGAIGVEGDCFVEVFCGGGLGPGGGSGADGGFVGGAGLLDFLLVFGLPVFFAGAVAGGGEGHCENCSWQQ